MRVACASFTQAFYRFSASEPILTDDVRINNVLSRQIPYAIGQFTVNELCHEIVFRSISEETRRTLSSTSKFTIQLGSGIIAGFAAAILSQVSICVDSEVSSPRLSDLCMQPADTLLSQINKGHGPKGSMPHRLAVLAREAGFRGLFAGLGPRMIMTAGLVSGQFLLYGAIKEGKHQGNFTFHSLTIHNSFGRTPWCRDPQRN